MLFRWVPNAYSLQRSQTAEDVISLTQFWKSRVLPSVNTVLLSLSSSLSSLCTFSLILRVPPKRKKKKKKRKEKTDAVHKPQVMLCVFLTVLFLFFVFSL